VKTHLRITVNTLHETGTPHREIARRTGVDRKTIRRYVRLAMVEALRGKVGHLTLSRLTIDSYEREEYLLFSGFDEAGGSLDQETMEKMFACAGRVEGTSATPDAVAQRLTAEAEQAGAPATPPAAGHLQGRGRDHGKARPAHRIAGAAAGSANRDGDAVHNPVASCVKPLPYMTLWHHLQNTQTDKYIYSSQ